MPENGGVYLLLASDLDKYILRYAPIVLKYDKNTDTVGHASYNFGACKGMTFDRVLIFPNKPLLSFVKNGTPLNSPSKYYVAATRARHSIAIVVNDLISNSSFKISEIELNGYTLQTSKYVPTKIRE